MAKKTRGNKSQAIIEYKEAHPDEKPKAIAEALQAKGHDINAGYVSTILSKSKKTGAPGKRGRKKGTKGVSAVRAVQTKKKRKKSTTSTVSSSTGQEVSVDTLLKVRDLVHSTGGVEAVQSALNTYQKLMDK